MENENLELFASCLSGLEALLAEELKGLGIRRVRPLAGGVAFFGDAQGAERACLWSRLASRVLLVVGRASARDADALYEDVRALPWESVVADGASIAVRAHGMNDELRNTRFTALKVKDALCDHLREHCGKRPDVDAQDPDALIDVRVHDDRATVSLDLSGESLHRRTYLTPDDGDNAQLSCAHAAGLLALAGWGRAAQGGAALVDPVCNDGFVVVEAALAACDVAPGLARDAWGFFGWAAHDERAWDALLDEADDRAARGLAAEVAGSCGTSGAVQGPSREAGVEHAAADAATAKEGALPHAALSRARSGSAPSSASAASDFSRVRFVGTSASSPAIARARTHVRRAGLRQVASIEALPDDGVAAVVWRVFAARAARPAREESAGALPCGVVASVMLQGHSSSDARAVSEVAAFASACGAAPDGSTFAIAGGEGVEARFGASPRVCVEMGRGRIAVQARMFDHAPTPAQVVMVPDTAGGAEHRVEVHEAACEQFVSRVRKAAKERRKWARREGVSCYRLYDADLPEYAVAIDVYEGAAQAVGKTFVHVAEYQAPSSIDPDKARCRFEDVLAVLPTALGVRPDHVFSKVRQRAKGGGQYREAGRNSYVTCTQEGGYTFEIDLAGYLDTGLFLDHRPTRALVGARARGTRFLNLFAYTGTATVHAAGGGAVETTTVDLSQTYLDWARRNMELNGFSGSEHAFERADVMTWVTQARRSPRRFDLVFVDPPTFSNSKAMGTRTWDVQRDHAELLIGVSRLLVPGGTAVFSCNLRTFKPDVETLAKYGVSLEDISAATIPHDFERNPRIHQCYLMTRA